MTRDHKGALEKRRQLVAEATRILGHAPSWRELQRLKLLKRPEVQQVLQDMKKRTPVKAKAPWHRRFLWGLMQRCTNCGSRDLEAWNDKKTICKKCGQET